ncbi:hypothetical protein M2305_003264 [Gluconobacter cerinus]|uniref:hypothetical protein n=1 Tax=Gluconobacter cerinus TaxID=38307 RepID=UPI002226DCE7|nr:hypothetical protein [Gluconobacter cerinus]MCW2267245.1 hypothetical protein [Gluconobacter cerinus]
MDTQDKLKYIKKLKDREFLDCIMAALDHEKFPKHGEVIVKWGNNVGKMYIACTELIDTKFDVTYIVENSGSFKVVYDKNKNAIKVKSELTYKKEQIYIVAEHATIKFSFVGGSFIALDFVNDYKITDCSCASVINAYLFRNPYKTFNKETMMILELSEF